MDLIVMDELAGFNKNYTFLLTIIDLFSRYLWVIPLKNNTGKHVADELDKFFDKLIQLPTVISTDNGVEFINENTEAIFKKYDIKHIRSLPNKPSSHGSVERVNRTIKMRIYKYLTNESTKVYYDVLQKLVDNYNNTVHTTTKTRPVDAQKLDLDRELHRFVVDNVETAADKILSSRHFPEIKVGDFVRVSKLVESKERAQHNAGFRKGYKNNWSDEIYHVVARSSVRKHLNQLYGIDRFTIETFDDEPVTLHVYRYDLLKIDPNKLIAKKGMKDADYDEEVKEFHRQGQELDERNQALIERDEDKIANDLLVHSIALNKPVRERRLPKRFEE
jgi:hypothetical protein